MKNFETSSGASAGGFCPVRHLGEQRLGLPMPGSSTVEIWSESEKEKHVCSLGARKGDNVAIAQGSLAKTLSWHGRYQHFSSIGRISLKIEREVQRKRERETS